MSKGNIELILETIFAEMLRKVELPKERPALSEFEEVATLHWLKAELTEAENCENCQIS